MDAVISHEQLDPTAPNDAPRVGMMSAHWPVLVPATFFASSGIVLLAQNYWSTEQGGHGPIILATGLWLLWERAKGVTATISPLRTVIAVLAIITFGLFAVVAAITVKQFLQVAGIYGALIALLFLFVGWNGLRKLWAPVLYLAFLIPPPDNLIIPLTHSLKWKIAVNAVNLLSACGYPVAREGASLFIGPYELVVAAACSGLNSLVSLLAIGLFYTYVMHPRNWRYAVLLALFIIPVAIFANFVRVVAILLITYYFGDAIGQSIIHDAMGLIVFMVAMGSLIVVDAALYPLVTRNRGPIGRRIELANG